MSYSSFVQLFAACVGIVGSLFFAIGVVRQSTEAMAGLSGSYYDSNPHMPRMLSEQKADYVFGGGLILVAFTLQFLSFLASSAVMLEESRVGLVLALAAVGTVVLFLIFRLCAAKLAKHYERKVNDFMQKEEDEHQRKRAEQKAEKRAPT